MKKSKISLAFGLAAVASLGATTIGQAADKVIANVAGDAVKFEKDINVEANIKTSKVYKEVEKNVEVVETEYIAPVVELQKENAAKVELAKATEEKKVFTEVVEVATENKQAVTENKLEVSEVKKTQETALVVEAKVEEKKVYTEVKEDTTLVEVAGAVAEKPVEEVKEVETPVIELAPAVEVKEEVKPVEAPVEEVVPAVEVKEEVKAEETPVAEVAPTVETKEEKPVVAPVVENQGLDTVSQIVSSARSLVGMPYVYASASPSVGFDCSGLVYYLYATYANTYLPRTSFDQVSVGYAVSVDSMQPGDIILFQNEWSQGCDHVGIYVGNGEYIHAATEERGVVTDSTSGSYFQNRVIGIRRVLN